MAEVAATLGIYRRVVGARIRSQLQYRVSFALDVVGTLLVSFLDFGAILVIFHQVPALGGWSVGEVAFLYAISSITFSVSDMVLGHLEQISRLVRDGTFDLILVRPLGSLFQVVSSDFSLRRLGRVVQSVCVLVYALIVVDVDWSVGRAAMLALTFVTGPLIFAGVWIAGCALTFWTIERTEFANAFTDGGSFLAQYPINIYGPWVRRFLAFVVPMAFVAYFPALYVLDKDDALGLPRALQFASPLAAAASVAGGLLAWRFAVRRYRSAGG